MRKHLFTSAAVLALSASAALASDPQGCVLKVEPSQLDPGCLVFNGYSNNVFVGPFHLNMMNQQRFVTAGGACPSDYLPGGQIAANELVVLGYVYTLAGDCLHSTTERAK